MAIQKAFAPGGTQKRTSSRKGAASTQDLRQVACSMATYPIYLVIYLSNLSFYLSVYLCIYPIYLAI